LSEPQVSVAQNIHSMTLASLRSQTKRCAWWPHMVATPRNPHISVYSGAYSQSIRPLCVQWGDRWCWVDVTKSGYISLIFVRPVVKATEAWCRC